MVRTALLLLATTATVSAQAASRSLSIDAMPLLTSRGAQFAVEPAVWHHASIRLALHAQHQREVLGRVYFSDGSLVSSDRLQSLTAEGRAYPVRLTTRTGAHHVLPFASLGVVFGYRVLEGRWCESRETDYYPFSRRVCGNGAQQILRVAPTASAGLRFLPGRAFLDVGGRIAWGEPGEAGGPATRDWDLRAEVALGYTW